MFRHYLAALLVLPTAAMAQPADPFARAKTDIAKFCIAQRVQAKQNCNQDQKAGLGRFVMIMAGFDDPGQRVARRCMLMSKAAKYINWDAAKKCMQAATIGVPIGGRLKGS